MVSTAATVVSAESSLLHPTAINESVLKSSAAVFMLFFMCALDLPYWCRARKWPGRTQPRTLGESGTSHVAFR